MCANMKKRVAVFLAMLMILPAVVAILPMTATEVQAADVYMGWNIPGYGNKTIQVEKGQKFYVGDYAYITSYGSNAWYGSASMANASYKSSKTSVASVNSKGYFTAKGTGTTTITVKYKGKSTKCKFQVVPSGTFTKNSGVKAIEKQAEALVKKFPSGIKSGNAFSMQKLRKSYKAEADKYYSDIREDGFLKEKKNGSYYAEETCKLAVPAAGRYRTLESMLSNYADKASPTSTKSARCMKIASLSASAGGISIKLKKSLTKNDIVAANISYSYQNEKVSDKTATIVITLVDETSKNDYVTAYAELKKGSKNIKLVPKNAKYENGKVKYVPVKLKKGHTYRIGSVLEWAKGKKVKIK